MAFLDKQEVHELYLQSKEEGDQWRKDYQEYERLADNDLIEDLDENLPEVNDGSLAAALFKLPKRIVSSKLSGRAKALDVDDAWVTELANMQWENEIIPHANSQAPFHRKWKDAVRKAAIYGGQPIITLFVENGDYTGADFIVPQAQDVTLEVGKVSDYDSDVIFWDVYFSHKQVKDMLEQAKSENKDGDGYNKWDTQALADILNRKDEEDRDSRNENNAKLDKAVKKGGYHFYVAFQRGVGAPFYMCHTRTKKIVREWTNQDPTGDIPVHYLYCYQNMINPYGVGIVKLAGGTQNVLDFMRQSDVLATQLGLRPPKKIKGAEEQVDLESLVYAQDADWFVGNADVERVEISNQVYQQLPDRINMYKTSLNNILPMGDTSVGAAAGDPLQSKTPAGVKLQAANLSIDDEDFKDNLYMTYGAVAKSMINIHFANMQGTDIMKLSDEERDILIKAGMDWPVDADGQLIETNELDVIWDEVRATFDFEVDAEQDKAKDDDKRLEALLKVAEFRTSDPNFDVALQMSGKRLNLGELYSEIIGLTTDNDKIIEDISPEEQAAEEEALADEQIQPTAQPDITPEQALANMQAVMEQYNVDEPTAAAMLEAERQGFEPQEILDGLARNQGVVNG